MEFKRILISLNFLNACSYDLKPQFIFQYASFNQALLLLIAMYWDGQVFYLSDIICIKYNFLDFQTIC